MIASRFALDKLVRNSAASVAKPFAYGRGAATAARGMSSNVEVEHGRGEWKTYGDIDNYEQGKYQVKTFNKISPVGLARFNKGNYDVRTNDDEAANAHAILLRSHKLQEDDVPNTVRAIARYVCHSEQPKSKLCFINHCRSLQSDKVDFREDFLFSESSTIFLPVSRRPQFLISCFKNFSKLSSIFLFEDVVLVPTTSPFLA
jgi:hypothetical protein